MSKLFQNENIIFFSSDDWTSGLKTSKYHLAIRLAKKNRVLYVNSIGLRQPKATASSLRKVIKRLRMWFSGLKKIDDNLFVITPIVVPFHRYRLIQRLNKLLIVAMVRY